MEWGHRLYQSSMVTACIIVTSLAFILEASAWGPVGHGAVGLIAEKTIQPSVRLKVIEVLGNQDFAQAGVWADTIKNNQTWVHTKPYHFADIPDHQTYLQNLKNLNSQEQNLGDIVRALVKAEDTLRNRNSSAAEKTYALKFIFHFVGDLHQPLHVGRPSDKGGNAIIVAWFANPSNLHAVWDSGMINTFIQRSIKPPPHQPTPTYTATDLMKYLRQPSAQEITNWQSSYIATWTSESLNLRDKAYDGDAGMSENYFGLNHYQANDRILKAGYRLGAWLNQIFTGKALSPEAKQLRSDIESIIPNGSDQVTLTERSAPSNFEFMTNGWQDPCAGHSH